MDSYRTIEKTSVGEFKDRGSKFIAFAYPIKSTEEFKEKLASLKKEHPKAAHHCFAYRLGTSGDNFRVSDDGEPSGSAGRPILGQIDSLEISNVLVVVVRYFGGTLLGVPGLINAYKTVSALALEANRIIIRPIMTQLRIEFDYTRMNDVMRAIKKYEAEITKQDAGIYCLFEIAVPQKNASTFLNELNKNGEQLAALI